MLRSLYNVNKAESITMNQAFQLRDQIPQYHIYNDHSGKFWIEMLGLSLSHAALLAPKSVADHIS